MCIIILRVPCTYMYISFIGKFASINLLKNIRFYLKKG